jgi:hypothetical protein
VKKDELKVYVLAVMAAIALVSVLQAGIWLTGWRVYEGYELYPEHDRHRVEQSAACRAAGGFPVTEYDGGLRMAVYRDCRMPCGAAGVER